MPELPEVETISRALREGGRGGLSILGRTISRVDIFWPKTIAIPSAEDFSARIIGQASRLFHGEPNTWC